jgi:hypothetical protein
MTTTRGVFVGVVVVLVRIALSLSSLSSSLSSSSSWMISPNFSGEMRLCDDDVRDDEEENKSTSF